MCIEAILSSLRGPPSLVLTPLTCVMLMVASLISPSHRRGSRHKAVRSYAQGHGGHRVEVRLGPRQSISRAHTLDLYTRHWPQSSSHHPSPGRQATLTLLLYRKSSSLVVTFKEKKVVPPKGVAVVISILGRKKDEISFNTSASFTMPVWCLFCLALDAWRRVKQGGFSWRQVNTRPFTMS